ncbi:MAG: SDR family NAD(P)-dependent oxidoreductase [Rhodospirillales bacterium]|nr:SDR family NAD(P)-dependent oxidoreductase [Rhodospirillales bacterium]
MEYKDKNVVITGGAGALGTAVAGLLLERGAICHVPILDPREKAAYAYASHERMSLVSGIDLTDESAVVGYYQSLPALWASIQIAGGFAMAPLGETSKDDFLAQMNMNALSCFLCCREGVKKIRAAQHTGRGAAGGRIVNVAARPALEPRLGAGMSAYTAAKAAVAALTQALGEELAAEGIWVNAVAPSILDTPANRAAMPDSDHSKWPGLEEVAETILFLASPANGASRGAVVPVYGKS